MRGGRRTLLQADADRGGYRTASAQVHGAETLPNSARMRSRDAGKRPLGNPNGARALRRAGKGNKAAVAARKVKADRHAQDEMPVIDDIRAAGILMLRGITAELIVNRRYGDRRPGEWAHRPTIDAPSAAPGSSGG